MSAARGHLILVGYYNCPGVSQDTIDVHLDTWLFCHSHVAINDGSSRIHYDDKLSKLDLIVEPDNTRRLSRVATILVGYSDHKLVKAEFQCPRPPVPAVTYSYRNYRRMEMAAFRKSLQKFVSILSPPADLDDAVKQLNYERHAPLRTRKRRQWKNNS